MQGITARLAKGAGWLTVTRVLVNLAALANMLLLARLLIPDDFGVVAIAMVVSSIANSLTDLSLTPALVRHHDLRDEHFHGVLTLNLARGAIFALLIGVLAVPIAQLYGDPRLVSILIVLGLTTLIAGTANPKMAVFARELNFFRGDFVIGVSRRVFGLIVAAAVAILFRSYWALVAGAVAMQVSDSVLSYLLIPYRPRLKLERVGELLSFSVWITLSQTVNTLNWKFDQLIVGYFLGNTSLGFYTVGDNLAVLPTRESTAPLAQALFPGFARLTHDPTRLRKAYQRAQAFLCAMALPLGCGLAIIAKPLIWLTLGAQWLPAVIVIQLLASIFALQTLSSTVEPLALAMGKTRSLFQRDLLNFGIRLPLVTIGLVTGGLVGIVYARCISGLVAVAINMEMIRRILGLSFRDQLAVNLRSLISVGVMVLGVFLIGQMIGDVDGQLRLAIKIAVMVSTGAVIYIGTLYGLWCFAGRPDGPESEVVKLPGRILDRAKGL